MKIPLHIHKPFGSKCESVGHYRKHTIGELGSIGLLYLPTMKEKSLYLQWTKCIEMISIITSIPVGIVLRFSNCVFNFSTKKRSRKLLGKEWGRKKLHYYLRLVMVKWIIEQRKFAASGLDEKLSKLFGRYSVKFLEELPNMVHFVSKFSWHPIKGRGIVNWVRNDIGLECHDICLECKFKKLLPHCEMQLRIVGRF